MASFLIAGLGNPGSEYSRTRHNIGFQVVDLLAQRWGKPRFQKKFRSLFAQTSIGTEPVTLLKPQTYMNLSGDAIRDVVAFYKLSAQTQLLVISDDLDLPTGKLRIRKFGGSGGHNGLASVIEQVGTDRFARMRIGIGKPQEREGRDHVLGKATQEEQQLLEEAIAQAADAVEMMLKDDIDKAMNTFNRKEEKADTPEENNSEKKSDES